MIQGFNVYKNDRFIAFLPARSHKACKEFIRDGKVSIGTHMGEWKRIGVPRPENYGKSCFEYEYATTVGAYIRFIPALSETQ